MGKVVIWNGGIVNVELIPCCESRFSGLASAKSLYICNNMVHEELGAHEEVRPVVNVGNWFPCRTIHRVSN
jgi:hypothetical protein